MSIEFSGPTFLTDSTARLKYYSDRSGCVDRIGGIVAVEYCSQRDAARRLRNSSIEITHETFAARATKRTKFQNRIPFLYGPTYEGISLWDLSLSFSPPSPCPFFSFPSLGWLFQRTSTSTATQLVWKRMGTGGTLCVAHNLYLLVPLLLGRSDANTRQGRYKRDTSLIRR